MSNQMKKLTGRPPGPPKDHWHAKIDTEVALFFRLRLLDPFTGHVRNGAISELCNRLLRDEMQRLQALEKQNG